MATCIFTMHIYSLMKGCVCPITSQLERFGAPAQSCTRSMAKQSLCNAILASLQFAARPGSQRWLCGGAAYAGGIGSAAEAVCQGPEDSGIAAADSCKLQSLIAGSGPNNLGARAGHQQPARLLRGTRRGETSPTLRCRWSARRAMTVVVGLRRLQSGLSCARGRSTRAPAHFTSSRWAAAFAARQKPTGRMSVWHDQAILGYASLTRWQYEELVSTLRM